MVCKMLGLVERARLLRHERILKRALRRALGSEHDAERLALAMCGAGCWLANASPGSVVCIRSSLSSLGPGRWGPVCGALRRAARDESGKGNAAHYLVFALLAAIIDSWTIEIICPSIAPRASAFRHRATVFADDLTTTALRLVVPDMGGMHGSPGERPWDSTWAPAEERIGPRQERVPGASLLTGA